MDLKTWLIRNRVSQKQLGDRIKISAQGILHIASFHHAPQLKTAMLITHVTNNEVELIDLLPPQQAQEYLDLIAQIQKFSTIQETWEDVFPLKPKK